MMRKNREPAIRPLWPLLAAMGLLTLALLLFIFLRENRRAMDNLYLYLAAPYQHLAGWLTGFLPFSFAEGLTVLFVLFCLFVVGKALRDLLRAFSLRLLCRKLLLLCIIALSVCTGISYLWGVCYYRTPFEEQIGIAAAPVSLEALEKTTAHYAALVNDAAPLVNRTHGEEVELSVPDVFARSADLYAPLQEQYPFLFAGASPRAKPLFLSEGMSRLNYTGIFFPFTGEANVNDRTPAAFLPSTIAHELAHSRGVGPEQTANFVAILACTASDMPEYRYSGALLGYLHLSNALFGADRERWRSMSGSLCAQAEADLRYNNDYWAGYESPAAEFADTVYESFLQSYDQELGLKSYGAVVDLLVNYHSP